MMGEEKLGRPVYEPKELGKKVDSEKTGNMTWENCGKSWKELSKLTGIVEQITEQPNFITQTPKSRRG